MGRVAGCTAALLVPLALFDTLAVYTAARALVQVTLTYELARGYRPKRGDDA